MQEQYMQQMSIFDDVIERYKITKPIRLIEFFAGIGSQAKALEVLGANFEHYKICEWAYNSYCAYNSIHIKDKTDYSKDLSKEELVKLVNGTSINYNEPLTLDQLNKKPVEWLRNAYNNIKATHNLVNIMNVKGKDLEIVDTDKYVYLVSYSFPCQDLSLAGKRGGMSVSQAEGGTRSGLLWEIERILAELRNDSQNSLPQILVMENVPEVCGKKNVKDMEKWQMRLNQLGYTNYCEILNAKDYGIPQNRRRCFMVSILGDYNYTFPKKIQLKYRLKDLLEKNVDEKYFLSQKMLNYCMAENTGSYKRKEAFETCLKNTNEVGVACSLTTRMGRGALDNYVHEYNNKALNETINNNKVEDGDFIDAYNRDVKKDVAGTILTGVSSRNNTFIAIKNNNSKGYENAEDGDGIDISTRMHHHRGTVQHGSAQTITCMGGENVGVVVGYNENSIKHLENNIVKDGIAQTLVTNSNFTGNGVNLIEVPNLKQELCDKLIEENKVVEGDIVKHSRTKKASQDIDTSIIKDNSIPSLTTRPDVLGVTTTNLRIRKLTPLECMKLMGFTKADTDSLREIGLSDAAIYHCAGDSIVSTVLVGIFSNLINDLNSHEKIINDYVEKEIL